MSTTLPGPDTARSQQPTSAPAPAPTPSVPPPAAPHPARKAPRPYVRRLVITAVLALIAAGVVFAMRPQPVTVDVAAVTVGPMQLTVDADAVTRVRARYSVTAPVTGLVQRIDLREGAVVRAGQSVALVRAAPASPVERRAAESKVAAARAARGQAVARVAQMEALLAQAQNERRRVRELTSAGALAERDLESATVAETSRRADLDAARAQLVVADADLATARAALDAIGDGRVVTPVQAPAAGRVLRVPDPSARVVAAGTPLLEVGNPRTLEVVADVLSSDAANVRAGQSVTLRGWGGEPLRGVVRLVEPSGRTRISALGVEEQRLSVVIDLVETPPTLEDGYRLDASIVVWEGRSVLTIPAGAALRAGEGWTVYVSADGRARRRDVRLGHVGGGKAEVLVGLRRGESVIVFPPDDLRDGTRVRSGG